jgi:hypothetical protein
MSFDTELLEKKRWIWLNMAGSVRMWINGDRTFDQHTNTLLYWQARIAEL